MNGAAKDKETQVRAEQQGACNTINTINNNNNNNNNTHTKQQE